MQCTDQCPSPFFPIVICPGKGRCLGGHLSGWDICTGDICPGKELIGVFHTLGKVM